MEKQMFYITIAVFVGGAAGTLLRFFINEWSSMALFPLGTVIENISGSLLLGLLTGWAAYRYMNPFFKEGLGAGFCGGFTTMSTLMADVTLLATAGGEAVLMTGLYVFVSLAGGLIAAFTGIVLGERFAGKEGDGA
ncbi:fluoride efflux transporter FluC [Salisediminibacterium selenitireducens]|uniref:Fluoride-specific ion channel FluC n=1 Tax=Bacillus selenitireducens (strain ATCC 700615 / DSM 15326 / MLS10) TaxID=439292 RepID=D6XXI5_BACIE|nr:CrcB family protein [Salisediminibacterium selenitireducens]ADH98042.1 Camphor resistance CrcB protein [[Bacillus] selenitireducens MLS10]